LGNEIAKQKKSENYESAVHMIAGFLFLSYWFWIDDVYGYEMKRVWLEWCLWLTKGQVHSPTNCKIQYIQSGLECQSKLFSILNDFLFIGSIFENAIVPKVVSSLEVELQYGVPFLV